jgi:hypothetical protein
LSHPCIRTAAFGLDLCSDEHNYLAWTQVRPSVGARAPALRARVTNHKDLLPGLDGRTGAARRFRDLVNSYIADMGGLDRCSEIRLGLLRRLAATTVQAERCSRRAW